MVLYAENKNSRRSDESYVFYCLGLPYRKRY